MNRRLEESELNAEELSLNPDPEHEKSGLIQRGSAV